MSENKETQKQTFIPEDLQKSENQAAVNAMVASAVKEAVAAAMAGMAPILESMALTPDRLSILSGKDPTAEAASRARVAREKKEWGVADAQARKTLAALQATCPHKDGNEHSSIRLMRNYPDRQPRGMCMKCHLLITPRQWVYDAPLPDGTPQPRLQDAHPLYHLVLEALAREGQG
jgi:hypothetical protein